ncbi:hypothetical protein BDK51DRAFT_44320 [Blyttiomyces helicus]|uniref:SP-RING-type domain-containing protein n=1 Tax=Blyttiomyces helicus TaxID=388810 RepID=A0A4P9W115_9FUNG|nr:hypothetical protein BDK51DRAFT_44320 [Blyttiomyces helicus]|eukprot:RKO84260.1 hypothetical protein BDK51DRAFT_44320 [Blyttiomyces helicus]
MDDDDLVATSCAVALKDPVSKIRIALPARSSQCRHLEPFDLATFFALNEQVPTWSCPICNRQVPWDSIGIDGYFVDVLKAVPEDAELVEILEDGKWALPRKVPHKGEEERKAKRLKDEEESRGPSKSEEVFWIDDDEDDANEDISQKSAASAQGPVNSQRGAQPEAEVIDLTLDSDSDDDEPAPLPRSTTTRALSTGQVKSEPLTPQLPQPPPPPSPCSWPPFTSPELAFLGNYLVESSSRPRSEYAPASVPFSRPLAAELARLLPQQSQRLSPYGTQIATTSPSAPLLQYVQSRSTTPGVDLLANQVYWDDLPDGSSRASSRPALERLARDESNPVEQEDMTFRANRSSNWDDLPDRPSRASSRSALDDSNPKEDEDMAFRANRSPNRTREHAFESDDVNPPEVEDNRGPKGTRQEAFEPARAGPLEQEDTSFRRNRPPKRTREQAFEPDYSDSSESEEEDDLAFGARDPKRIRDEAYELDSWDDAMFGSCSARDSLGWGGPR